MFKKDYCKNTLHSSTSSLSIASSKIKSAWSQLSGLFTHIKSNGSTSPSSSSFTLASSTFTTNQHRTVTSSRNTSLSTPPSSSFTSRSSSGSKHTRKKKWIERNNAVSDITVPPFSPTYCKPNEFPYSNFYVKLPNGKWMIRYRSGDRDILGTDVFDDFVTPCWRLMYPLSLSFKTTIGVKLTLVTSRSGGV
ncbi:hypothetical protein BC941DRAFT_469025 [Chlamydoabsidia padenii]|nr:hypothetical protein BC941DRAFT_469025 [Chlamydoabsidia padenii]